MSNVIVNIKNIIAEKGYKQAAIAKKSGFTTKNFSELLCGRKTFKAEYVNPICNALDVTPNELFGVYPKSV